MTTPTKHDVAIIGGGIIGLCVAEKLRQDGHQVVIIERQAIAAGASGGNAAAFAFAEIMPLASGAMIRQSFNWLLDPTGPFAVVARDLPHTAGWLMRFALAARSANFQRGMRALAALMQLERKTLPAMLTRTGLQEMVRTIGALYLYRSPRALERDLTSWQVKGEHGIDFEVLRGGALHECQSGLSETLVGGVHIPDFQSATDPREYCRALHRTLADIETISGEVTQIETADDDVVIHGDGFESARAKYAVIAAGTQSGKLAATLGDRVPLISERGYNTTYPKAAFADLQKTLFFKEHGFAMTPLANAIRVGGASEIATETRAPNFHRAVVMANKARAFAPSFQPRDGSQWLGFRPSTPDTLPVIGHACASNRVIYAFGHGHLGLTMSTSTAQLVADLIAGRESEVDVAGLSVGRFG